MLIKQTFLSLSLAAIIGTLPLSAVSAKGADVCALDSQKLLATSDAGKSMKSQLDRISKSTGAPLESKVKAVQAEKTSLETLLKGKSREELAQPAIKSKYEGFQKNLGDLEVERRKAVREMQLTERDAIIKFNKQTDPIVKQVMGSRGCGIVVDRSATLLTLEQYDITDEVIRQLNSKVKNITISKVSLPTK